MAGLSCHVRFALIMAVSCVGRRYALLSRLNEQILAADKRISKVKIELGSEHGVILVADSSGRITDDVQPMTRLGIQCVAEDKGRRETNFAGISARAGLEYYTAERLTKLVNDLVDRTTVFFDAVPAPIGEMTVVMGAGSSGILMHESIGHGLEADWNRQNTSIYADKLGQPIANSFINIVDDGTVQHARRSINVDDEGTLGQRTILVEGGRLASYMHDKISARHYGVKPTGNGRRESYRFAPLPRMRVTYLLPGPHAKEEILSSVKRGIYCQYFDNGEAGIGGGDFTFFVKNGWLIESGRLTRPVKDINLIGNGPRVLEQIDMVADDLIIDTLFWTCGKNGQRVPVSVGLPTLRVPSLTIGGSKPS